MNAVEIADAVAELAALPFDAAEFPFAFLKALDVSDTTLKQLRKASGSETPGAYLIRNKVHIAVAAPGQAAETLRQLKASPKTTKSKCKFAIATDGEMVEAEELAMPEYMSFRYADLGKQVGFFFPLAGISTVKEIKNNPIDIRATGFLNKLYVELMKDNPEWATEKRRPDLNQFMARLIFCLFAEDTGIFGGENLFSATLTQFTDSQSNNTHEVITELFRAMDARHEDRAKAKLKDWTVQFPYVNGGLFTKSVDCPRFSRIARSYLLRACELNWREINPDIFGSMIQAVADDDERGDLGMHYTSVPNILKVLDPLFLDDLREELEKAGDGKTKASAEKLSRLRQRMANIRVFDPACGSGNFLVIAYLRMREIEWEIIERLGKVGDLFESRSQIRLTNFFGIEIKSFAAEIAKLSLLIAEFQANVKYLGAKDARAEVLPLHESGKVHVGNALRLDWVEVCPPAMPHSLVEHDLGWPTGRLALEATTPVETFICGNPPYLGSTWQSPEHKEDLRSLFEASTDLWRSLDYVAGWFMKASQYGVATPTKSAFVSTNSVCQGQQVAILWPLIFAQNREIDFAHSSFKWANLASHNAGVTVVIVGLRQLMPRELKRLFVHGPDGASVREVDEINPYLIQGRNVVVRKASRPLGPGSELDFGSKPVDGGHLLLDASELAALDLSDQQRRKYIRRVYGSAEFINGRERHCIWIADTEVEKASTVPALQARINRVAEMRKASEKSATNTAAAWAHKFGETRQRGDEAVIAVPAISSENRDYLPCGVLPAGTIVTNKIYGFYDAPLWNMALIASRLHWVWIGTVCVRMRTDFSYSNTLGWNTFPVPALTDAQKADLTRCAEDILLAREMHFPKTIADLYDPENMPDNLRAVHDKNDETLERIYIGRRFKNDTERLEKLFAMYTKMIKAEEAKAPTKGNRSKRATTN